jgi:hypothetical protein
MPTDSVPVVDIMSYKVYNVIHSKAKIPWFTTYDTFSETFANADRYAGVSLGKLKDVLEVLCALQSRSPHDTNVFYRNFIQNRKQLETDPPDYISHSFDGSDTRRTVLGCPVGYALVVTDRDISTAITVPEAWLCVAPGSVTKSDTSAMSLNVTIPHLEIALAAWEASFNADVERTKELGNAVEIWERFWTPDRQRDVQTIADLRKLSNSDTVIVLRIVAASGDRVFKLKRSLGNARTEFFMAASNNSTGFFVVAPDLADPYREPLRETLFLYDAD